MSRTKKPWSLFRPKERERFYLLPGMGGRALRRKQKTILTWTALAGTLTAGLLAVLIYYLNKRLGP